MKSEVQMLIDITEWMNDTIQSDCIWYAKRLSGNDTLANGTHQAGPYIPKNILFSLFPSLNRPEKQNPDGKFVPYGTTTNFMVGQEMRQGLRSWEEKNLLYLTLKVLEP